MELIKEWTDGDLQCCIAKESDTCFVYAEVRNVTPDRFCFVVDDVDIAKYTKEQLERIVVSWYSGGISEIKETYKDKANQIIAECVFENTGLLECMFISSVCETEDEAAEILEKYVNQYT